VPSPAPPTPAQPPTPAPAGAPVGDISAGLGGCFLAAAAAVGLLAHRRRRRRRQDAADAELHQQQHKQLLSAPQDWTLESVVDGRHQRPPQLLTSTGAAPAGGTLRLELADELQVGHSDNAISSTRALPAAASPTCL
jgi:hypothetical protein